MRPITEQKMDALYRLLDQRTALHGIDWKGFEAIVAIRGDAAGPRLAYLDGELEFMSPSEFHEGVKTTWARLLEAWSEVVGVELEGRGSWTLKTDPALRGGIEPDECYFVGRRGRKTVPDLALEVNWTHGTVDKLEIYRRLGVPEVWIWSQSVIELHVLGKSGYKRSRRSRVLPAIDLPLIHRCLAEPTQLRALKRLRRTLATRNFDA